MKLYEPQSQIKNAYNNNKDNVDMHRKNKEGKSAYA